MTESQLHRVCQTNLSPFILLKRIENRLELGMPDTVYCVRKNGATGWLELKEIPSLPVKPTTPIRIPTLTREQVMWQAAWHGAKGRCHTFLKAGDDYFLLAPPLVSAIYAGNICPPDLHAMATVRGVGTFPTMELMKCLSKPM